jgi:hypothetical protein
MEQRRITDVEIDATIRKPDGRYHDPKGQVVFFRMRRDGVNLDGLPQRDVIGRLLAERYFPVVA